tara:strand:+ start:361 stop:543 length:183 start_codon:yes stop_codon:yes gene_type:complete
MYNAIEDMDAVIALLIFIIGFGTFCGIAEHVAFLYWNWREDRDARREVQKERNILENMKL